MILVYQFALETFYFKITPSSVFYASVNSVIHSVIIHNLMISIMDEIDGLSISKPVDIVKLKLSATSLINY